jgi:hypothetical protein
MDTQNHIRYRRKAQHAVADHSGRVVRHELSSLAGTLGSWVRILLTKWMSVCVYPVLVLFCV